MKSLLPLIALLLLLPAQPSHAQDKPPADDASAEVRARVLKKMHRIIIPRIEFRDATVREAIDFLKKRSIELDTSQPPEKRGSGIFLHLDSEKPVATPAPPPTPDPDAPPGPADVKITLSLKDVPLDVALNMVADLAGLKMTIDARGTIGFRALTPQDRAAQPGDADVANLVLKKMKRIIFPKVEFHDADLRECLGYIAKRQMELDPDPDPAKRGVDFMLNLEGVEPKKVTLLLTDVPMDELLNTITDLTGTKLSITARGITIEARDKK